MVRAIDASGWLICLSCVVLGASCGGRASSNHEDPSDQGGTTSEAGNSGLAGSPPSSGGGSAHAGTSSAGGNAQAGTSSAGAQAGTSSAQAGGPGAGGNAQAGAPSAGGGGAVIDTKGDPASMQDACSGFCDEFNRCPDGEGNFGPSCEEQCFDYAYRPGSGECTAAGVDMLACLALADRVEESDCANAFTLAIEECAEMVDAFRDCQVDFPTPSLPSMLCAETSVAGSGQSSSCAQERTCLNRLDGEPGRRSVTYSVTCVDTDDGQSSCSCQTPTATKSFTVDDTTVSACIHHSCTTP